MPLSKLAFKKKKYPTHVCEQNNKNYAIKICVKTLTKQMCGVRS